jgi:hypothetical protein
MPRNSVEKRISDTIPLLYSPRLSPDAAAAATAIPQIVDDAARCVAIRLQMIGNSNFVFLPLLATESLKPHNKPNYDDKNKKQRHQTKNSLSLSLSLNYYPTNQRQHNKREKSDLQQQWKRTVMKRRKPKTKTKLPPTKHTHTHKARHKCL